MILNRINSKTKFESSFIALRQRVTNINIGIKCPYIKHYNE